jgi:hypothetical protein
MDTVRAIESHVVPERQRCEQTVVGQFENPIIFFARYGRSRWFSEIRYN